MVIETAISLAVGKTALDWLKDSLLKFEDERQKNKAEKKLWEQTVNTVLKQTKALANRYSKVTTVAFPQETVTLDSIYIPLTIKTTEQQYKINRYPESLFEKNKKILVIDVAGMGKSTISKILYLRSIGEHQIFPILIDLRRLSGKDSILDCLANQFGLRPKQLDLFAEFARTQPLLFLLDGFDEVPDSAKVDVSRLIRDFVDQNEKASFLITSRPEVHFSNYTDFQLFHIESLKKAEAYELITKYGAAFNIKDKANTLISELKAKHSVPISSFLENPLLCSLLFRAFEYKSVVPIKRGVFYRQVFDALYDSHDLNKEAGYVRNKKTGLHHDDFHRALRATASLFRQRKVVEVQLNDFIEIAKSICKSLCPDLAFKPEEFLSDVTVAVPVLTKDGNYVRWSHKSLMDYFLSEYLLRDYTKSKQEALHRVAFGPESLASENFLTLVHEADPTLFYTSVTIPAIDELLARHTQIEGVLSKYVDNMLLNDISVFYMGYDILISKRSVISPSADWSAYLKDAEDSGALKASDYFPQVVYNMNASLNKKGSLGLFMHKSFAALQVPIRNGGLPHLVLYSFSKRNNVESGRSREFKLQETSYSLLSSRFPSYDLSNMEDDFCEAAARISLSTLSIPTPASLERSKQELKKIVNLSIAARSTDIF